MDLLALVAEGLMIIILGWAAVERARMHRYWDALRQRRSRDEAVARSTDWYVAVVMAVCVG